MEVVTVNSRVNLRICVTYIEEIWCSQYKLNTVGCI